MNVRTQKVSLAIVATALAVLAATAAIAQASTNEGATKKGASWIAKTTKKTLIDFPGTGFRADAISALAAARKSGAGVKKSADDALLAYVRTNGSEYAATAGASAKVVLAAVAAGENPQCFGDANAKTDFVALVDSYYSTSGKSNGQYGSTAFDQALSMLAVKAAHHKIPKSAVKFAKNRRGSNGWNFAMTSSKGDDVESTALMIEALRAAGVSKNDKALKSAFKWMYNQRNANGGFNPTTPNTGATQANTTAYAIRAGDAMGKNLKESKAALRGLQKSTGWFRNDESSDTVLTHTAGIATSDSVIALSGRHYPVVIRSKAGASCG